MECSVLLHFWQFTETQRERLRCHSFFHADCKWNAPKYSWKFTDEKQNSNVFLSVTNHQGFFKKRLPTYQGCMKYCDSIFSILIGVKHCTEKFKGKNCPCIFFHIANSRISNVWMWVLGVILAPNSKIIRVRSVQHCIENIVKMSTGKAFYLSNTYLCLGHSWDWLSLS